MEGMSCMLLKFEYNLHYEKKIPEPEDERSEISEVGVMCKISANSVTCRPSCGDLTWNDSSLKRRLYRRITFELSLNLNQ